MSTDPVDDIVADLDRDQLLKLSELQAKVDHITNLPSFDDDVIEAESSKKASLKLSNGETSQLEIDMGVLRNKAFHKAVEGMTPASLMQGMWANVKHDDPDTLMVRHLRARNWDVDKALVMMLGSVRWRSNNGVQDTLLRGGDERLISLAEGESDGEASGKVAQEILAQVRSGKSFTHGTDKKGRPLLFVRVVKHNPSAQSLEGLEKYIVYQAETARMVLRPPHTMVAMVFDLGGFSMANMDWNAVKLLTAGLEDKYPESVGQLYIYRAPWIINGIWAVVKTWMPGEEANKVRFVYDAAQLSEHVDLEYIPSEMGGTGGFEYEYIEPADDENKVMQDTARRDELQKERDALVEEYEDATRRWIIKLQDEDADAEMLKRRELVKKIRENYWQIDPYIRGRTMLDRTGVIGAAGSYDPNK